MATSYLSPNMNLVLPVPTQEPGPAWAYDLVASLTTIDRHNHAFGSGVQINPSGININSDLTFNNSNNAIGLRTVRFFDQTLPIPAVSPDLGCLYTSSGNLYFNYGGGIIVPITLAGSVVGGAGAITGLPSGTASAAYQATSGTFQFQQATTTAANMDVASIAIRYPGSYPTLAGNYILLEAPSSLASAYSLTLPALPAQTNVMTLNPAGIIASITYDSVGVGMTATGANAIATARTRITGSTVGVGGVAVSGSSGAFSVTGNLATPVTNLSVTITTSGRPIFVGLQADGLFQSTGRTSQLGSSGTGSNGQGIFIQLLRAGLIINFSNTYAANVTSISILPSYFYIDAVAAGTYTYSISAGGVIITGAGTQTSVVTQCILVAYEL
jgi:hypothetical protein